MEGRVLDGLEFLIKVWRGVGDPNGSCMHEKGPDKGSIGDKYDFTYERFISYNNSFNKRFISGPLR